jgi:cytidyltransferase-like protein
MVKGYLFGSFDLFSVGDLDIIHQASRQCDELTVGILADDHVADLMGRAPVVPCHERIEIVRSVRGVSSAQPHDSGTALDQFDVVFDDPRLLQADVAFAGSVAIPLARPVGTSSPILRGYLASRSQAASDVA